MVDTKFSALPAAAALDGTEVVPLVQGGVPKRTTVADLAPSGETAKVVDANQANSTVTPAAIADLTTSLDPGTYRIKVWIVWQSAATTTGASFWINCSGGTVSRNVGHWYHLTTGGAAATGISDQISSTSQMVEGKAWRANNTDPTPCVGVDTANADELAIMEAIVVVTATTTMQIVFRSEVGGSAVTVQEGTTLEYEKVA